MEFVRGEDLRQRAAGASRRSPRERTIELMSGIALGVDAAHRAGVLHRDLKPENVLLPANGTGPKVLDFGVAKMTDASARRRDADAGRHHRRHAGVHGARAAARRARSTAAPDVYSLGVMTYEAADRRAAVRHAGRSSTSASSRRAAPAASTRHVCPDRSTAVLLRALASIARAPGSPAAFAAELRSTVTGSFSGLAAGALQDRPDASAARPASLARQPSRRSSSLYESAARRFSISATACVDLRLARGMSRCARAAAAARCARASAIRAAGRAPDLPAASCSSPPCGFPPVRPSVPGGGNLHQSVLRRHHP